MTPQIVQTRNDAGSTTITVSQLMAVHRGDYVLIGSARYRVTSVSGRFASSTLTVRPALLGWRETVRRYWEDWITFPVSDARRTLRRVLRRD